MPREMLLLAVDWAGQPELVAMFIFGTKSRCDHAEKHLLLALTTAQ